MIIGPAQFELRAKSQGLLWLGLFCFFMLTGSRERPWGDATPIYEVAEALVNRGEINIATAWPESLNRGRGGKTYAVAPILQSLQHVPGVLVRKLLVKVWPGTYELSWPFAAHMGPAALAAVTVVLFLSLCQGLGFALSSSLCAAAALAFGTMIWVYGRSPYGESLQAACFTAFFLGALRAISVHDTNVRRQGLVLGLTAGLLFNAKNVYVLTLIGASLCMLWCLWGQWRRIKHLVSWSLASFFPLALLLPLYNWARWGSLLESGYNFNIPVFEERLALGLWGLFLSPGKSLWLYCPPLLLSIVALPRLWRRLPKLGIMTLMLVGPVVLLYGKMLYWSGDYAWGPRYLTFALPVLLLPAVLVIEDGLRMPQAIHRRLALGAVTVVCLWGLGVQVLGSVFYWDHFIRISQEARAGWLGEPVRAGAPTPEVDGVCGACFEDVHQLHWLPPFNPIEGHWWLLKSQWAGDDHERAGQTAPWKRHTRIEISIEKSYSRVRFDWWPLEMVEHGRKGMAVVLCLWFLFGIVVAAWLLPAPLKTAVVAKEPTV